MQLTVNGQQYEIDAPGHERLLATLRERLSLSGTKMVCGRGECGACTVLVGGELAYSCVTLTAACAGCDVTTIEGLGNADELHPIQRAFIENDALQCGFCTPGQIIAALALLDVEPEPTDRQIVAGMSGNLCRCGAYPGIVDAVRAAGAAIRDAEAHGTASDGASTVPSRATANG